jgi:pre-mRNA-processing factor 40
VLTKWRDAHRRLLESPEYRADKELQELPNLDILLAFEDFSRAQEREFEEQLRRTQVDKARRERTARENFRALLAELVNKGALRARRKWKQVYPEFADDERYLGLLGMPGSNPLELFWDVVDGLDQRLDAKIAVIAAAIKVHDDAAKARGEVKAAEEGEEPRGFVVGADTTLEELLAVLGDDQGVKAMDRKDVEEVFYAVSPSDSLHAMYQLRRCRQLREDAVQKHEEERRRVDRKQRHLQDDLRYALKKMPEPLDLNAPFEDAVPAMEKLAEWQPLDDEGRRSAFSKFVKRQKVTF